MKKKLLLALAIMSLLVCIFAISVNAAAPAPQKPQLDVDFGEVKTIDGFAAPSELFVGTTQRVLLTDGEGNYVTYPTYYVTKNSTTFDLDFSNLNAAQPIQYDKTSIAMLEVPSGITAISRGYFNDNNGNGNFNACKYVQFPGSVTSYGDEVFCRNMTVKIVEFLDGTEDVTIGNSMFGGNNTGGKRGTAVEYVKFPNNLVSIGNGTFGFNTSPKTVILGERLKSIGTSFFGESCPRGVDTFLYVSDNFFSGETEMFTNLFGSYANYHNNHLRLVIFYTGTEEQAQALVEKGLAVQSTDYIWSASTLVSASEYDYATHKPTKDKSATIVYGYEICDLFYDGHKMSEEAEMQFTSYFEPIKFASVCENSTCTHTGYDESKTIGALFVNYGYSATETEIGGKLSMSQFYGINKENLAKYTEATGNTFEYGLVVSISNDPMASENEGLIANNKTFITASDKFNQELSAFSVAVSGFVADEGNSTVDNDITFCAYVKDGDKIAYLDNGKTVDTVEMKSFNDVLALVKSNENNNGEVTE